MGWDVVHNAARDRKVWLFLPSSRWTANPDGSPKQVTHEVVVGEWDDKHKFWFVRGQHGHIRIVYPSSWHDAPTDGPAPDQPELK